MQSFHITQVNTGHCYMLLVTISQITRLVLDTAIAAAFSALIFVVKKEAFFFYQIKNATPFEPTNKLT